jgi:multidrug efflux pump subunit AcrA (membrane-fusion protein)
MAANEASTEQPRRTHGLLWLILGLLLIGVILLVVFVGWLPRRDRQRTIDEQAKQEQNQKPRPVVYSVQRAPKASELLVPGTTLAYTEAYIYARASGYVAHRYVDIGDRVRAGQLLAVIDAPDLDREVSQARASLEQSESNLLQQQAQLHLNLLNWNRYQVLVAKGVLSRQQGDQQEANYRVADSNVKAAENSIQGNRENLQRLVVLQQYERVTAPFSGVITARNVDVGSLINAQGGGLSASTPTPGSSLAGAQDNNEGTSGSVSSAANPSTGGSQGGEMFGMAAIDRLRVLVSVPEAYSSAIRVGQQASLFFQANSQTSVLGRVTRTSASIDPNTRTLLVEVQVPNRDGKLMPGMYVVVNFIGVQAERPLLIPGESIVVRNAKQMVALVENNIVHFRPIDIGRDYGDQTEVTGGLHEGDVIVRTISDQIQDGAEIEPQYPKK